MMTDALTARGHGVVTWRWIVLGGAAIGGIVLRLVSYRSTLGLEDSDESFVGLMVRHALHGHLTGFLWGHAYGGIGEVLLGVPVFWLAGPSLPALRSVSLAIDVATVVVVWRVGKRTIGEPAATYAAALYWIWPAWTIYESIHEWGFYASDAFFSALLALLALRAKEQPTLRRVGIFGLVAGVAFYQTFQILPVVITVSVWLAWRQRGALRHAWIAAVLAIVGAMPAILWNLDHNRASLHLNPGADLGYTTRLRVLFSPVIPEDLGLRFSGSEAEVLPFAAGTVLYVILAALFLYGAYRSRRRDIALLYLTIGAFPFLAALSAKANVPDEPRYLMAIAPMLALVVGQLATTTRRAAAILALAVVVSAVGLHGFDRSKIARANVGIPTSPRSIAPLVSELDRLHVDRLFTNYWLAYRLDFDTKERIIGVENGFNRLVVRNGDVFPTHYAKATWPAYEKTVMAAPRHGFVFFDGFLPPAGQLSFLERHGYTRHEVPGFVVYAPPRTVS
jgi:Dolichyl-phosphate-mannose-protein mannosyltransferase